MPDRAAAARALRVTYNGSLVGWAFEPHAPLEARLRADIESTLAGWHPRAS